MTSLSPEQILTARPDLPPPPLTLHAGPVTALYDGGDLRYIRFNGQEVLRRVYAAVRDHNWGTAIPALSNVVIDAQPDRFHVRYDADYRLNAVDFAAQLTIDGAPDGTITFTFDGVARSGFCRNRIGFCVLHPMDLAGQPLTVEHTSGTVSESRFPLDIAPHQPVFDIRTLTHEVLPGVRANVRMEGDTFEMEDQRNWTDASYKTYCTPLALPYPAEVPAGTRIQQQITVRFTGAAGATAAPEAVPTITVGDQRAALPRLGLGVAGHGQPLSAGEVERLRALALDHLRVDLHFGQSNVEAALRQATGDARALGASLHVALHLTNNAGAELDDVARLAVALDAPVSVWLVFRAGENATGGDWLRQARARLADVRPGARFVTGSDAYFTQLNRNRPSPDALALLDGVSYGLNPQVHAFENVDLVETLAAQGATVASARAFSGGLPILVSTVTLKIRNNPDITGPAPEVPPGTLPPQVDPRQMSLFGAAWTLGSLKALAEVSADSATYYETTGWLGVMETAAGSPLPDRFPSLPGAVFPMYHVFADAAAFAGGTVTASVSSAPLVAEALVLEQGGRRRVLVANYTAEPQRVRLNGLTGPARLRSLDEATALDAMTAPAAFRAASTPVTAGPDGLTLTLRPYAVVTVDEDTP
jgi:hypothetical protein